MPMTFTVGLIRKVFVAIAGFTVLLIGIAMIVLPGPAVVVIPLGLAILATEFVWARSLLRKTRETIARQTPDKLKRKSKTNAVAPAE
jgi:tellurite resistance protein TerC